MSNNNLEVQAGFWSGRASLGTLPPVRCFSYNTPPSIPVDLESHCSLSTEDYPDSICQSSASLCLEDLDTADSLYSPRTSLESSVHQPGVNPTFFAGEDDEEEGLEEEEDYQKSQTRNPIRRIHSVVETNDTYKDNAQRASTQNLLLNPAYGSLSLDKEDLEKDTQVDIQTKLKSVQSIVKNGCRASSNVLVGNHYIGHTSTNPIFADLSSTDSCSESDMESLMPDMELEELPVDESTITFIYSPTKFGSFSETQEILHRESEFPNGDFLNALSPKIELEKAFLGTEMSTGNMGTLTWRNTAFMQSISSDEEYMESEGDQFCSPFSRKISEAYPVAFESSVLSPPSSSFADSSSPSSITEEVVKQSTDYEEKYKVDGSPLEQVVCFNSLNSFTGGDTFKTFENINLHSRDSISEETTSIGHFTSSDSVLSSSSSTSKMDSERRSVVPNKLLANSITKTTGIVGTSWIQTRSALRSLLLLAGRLDPARQSPKKQK
eukprot:g2588.t1